MSDKRIKVLVEFDGDEWEQMDTDMREAWIGAVLAAIDGTGAFASDYDGPEDVDE